LGIRPKEYAFWQAKSHSYAHARVHIHFFRISVAEGEPVAREGQHIAWISPARAGELNFLEADADVVNDLIAEETPCASQT